MIKASSVLTYIRGTMDPDESQAVELMLERDVHNHDAIMHIATITDYIMTLGVRSKLKFYDLDKLKADKIFVHRRPYGGSGTICGPLDVAMSLYINKRSFKAGYQVDSKAAYKVFVYAIAAALQDLGVECHVDESEILRAEDGVCVHLHGRSEIITPTGSKMVVSVYKEDEIGFYMRAMFLVTSDWAMIYDYLTMPVKPMHEIDSIEMRLGRHDVTRDVMDEVTNKISAFFLELDRQDLQPEMMAAVHGIKERFRVI